MKFKICSPHEWYTSNSIILSSTNPGDHHPASKLGYRASYDSIEVTPGNSRIQVTSFWYLIQLEFFPRISWSNTLIVILPLICRLDLRILNSL